MVARRPVHRLHEHERRQAPAAAVLDRRRRQRAPPRRRDSRELVDAELVALSLFPFLVLAAFARADVVAGSDYRYFADAASGSPAAVEWVLEIVVSHPKKPSRGFRRLPFQPDADADLEPAVDCQRLEPVPRARPHRGRAAALAGYEVCGVRLLHWTIGDADRLELAATAQKTVGGKKWVQVLIDPSLNRRAWLQFAPGRAGEPLMRLRRLVDWLTSARRGVVPGHLAGSVTLRVEPSEGGEPAPRQLPRAGDDVAVDVLGVQGEWIRLAAEGEDCERNDSEGSGVCPAGWTRWRAPDGQPLVLP